MQESSENMSFERARWRRIVQEDPTKALASRESTLVFATKSSERMERYVPATSVFKLDGRWLRTVD